MTELPKSVIKARTEMNEAWDEWMCALDLEIESGVFDTLNEEDARHKFTRAYKAYEIERDAFDANPTGYWEYQDWLSDKAVENEINSGRY
jgi:hypothetical protein